MSQRSTFPVRLIGLTGGSATGKSTVARHLAREVGGPTGCSTLSLDDFFIPKPKHVKAVDHNFDCPDAFDWDLLVGALRDLKAGRTALIPVYHHATSTRRSLQPVAATRTVIVEGILIAHDERVRELLDFSVFIKIAPEEQLRRRTARDVVERDCTEESVRFWWDNKVYPMQKQWIDPLEVLCDLALVCDSARSETIGAMIASSWLHHQDSQLAER